MTPPSQQDQGEIPEAGRLEELRQGVGWCWAEVDAVLAEVARRGESRMDAYELALRIQDVLPLDRSDLPAIDGGGGGAEELASERSEKDRPHLPLNESGGDGIGKFHTSARLSGPGSSDREGER